MEAMSLLSNLLKTRQRVRLGRPRGPPHDRMAEPPRVTLPIGSSMIPLSDSGLGEGGRVGG